MKQAALAIVATVATAIAFPRPAGAQAAGADDRPASLSIVADISPGLMFPDVPRVAPGLRVTMPRTAASAWELFADAGHGTNGVAGTFGVQYKRVHGDADEDVRVFHTFGLLGMYRNRMSACCMIDDRSGRQVGDTRTTSMEIVAPILPFAGVGIDGTLSRLTRWRAEADVGLFVMRGSVSISFQLTR